MVIFAVFFTVGIWLLQQQAALPQLVWAWLLPVYALLYPLLACRNHPAVRILQLVLLAAFAAGLGFSHAAWQAGQRLAVSLPDEWQGRDIEVVGVVAELPHRHERGLRFVFDVEQTITPLVVVPQRIYLSTYSDRLSRQPDLQAGERWQLTLRLRQPHGTANPHGFDFEVWALERNIRAVGYVHNKGNNRRIDRLADGYRIEAWREKVRARFDATLGGAPYTGVLSALAIGDQSSISAPLWQVFTRTGVNHLMSISGLHITMLAGMAFAFAYWLWRRSIYLTLRIPAGKAAALAALLTATGYALLSGFAVPAQRTVYMVGAIAIALWLNRNFSPGQILAMALLGVLIPDPWAVMSAGFWLSFGAMALIMYVTAYRVNGSRQEGGGVTSSLRMIEKFVNVQWAITIGLTPLLLGLFQQVSLVSPIANALAIPLVSLMVVPLTLLGTVLPLEVPLWLAHLVMEGVVSFLAELNTLPQAVWTQHAPPAWSIAAGVLGVWWALLPRGFPARWLGLLLLLPMFLNQPEKPAHGTLRLIIFDVGQGLAVAAQTREHALLYDTGPDFSGDADSANRILIPSLRALGIAALDGLMLSHDDIDHSGGTASIIQAMPVGAIWSGLPNRQQPRVQQHCREGMNWEWDGVHFEVLHPAHSSEVGRAHDNDQSCVLRISTGRHSILLTGDIEKTAEMRLIRQHADKLHTSLLVAPHHGSRSSSSYEFIAATLPDYAVFTAGYRNRFGHPREEVLQRYAYSGATLLRSDEDGAILVEMNDQHLRVERHRKAQHRYWTHAPPR